MVWLMAPPWHSVQCWFGVKMSHLAAQSLQWNAADVAG
jgi:hypothetical protein